LLERRGAKAAALRTWRDGFEYVRSKVRDDAYSIPAFLNELTLRSLCDQVDEEFTQRFMASVLGAASNGPLLRQAEGLGDRATMTQVFRRMWQSTLGHKLAEDLAFERVSLRERILIPIALAATEYANLAAYSGEMTDEEYAIVFQHTVNSCEKFVFA